MILAACGRMQGASHAIFDLAVAQSWRLLASHYVIREVEKNVPVMKPADFLRRERAAGRLGP